MVTSFLNRFAPINFDGYIDRLTDRFTGREWLFEQHIDPWLQQQGKEQFYLLTGEPGVGKSAIVAQLVKQFQDADQGILAAYHFCRAGDVETVRPGRVLRSIAAQLGETLPHYGKALKKVLEQVHLNIDVNIDIKELSNSRVTGIYIENLKDLDPTEELRLLIQAPLAALPAIYEAQGTELPQLKVFLIDSLDEAVTTTGRDNVATLIAALSQTNDLPPWIRFILTARPGILKANAGSGTALQFKSLQHYELEKLLEENLTDVERYITRRTHEEIERPKVTIISLWQGYQELQKEQPEESEKFRLFLSKYATHLITRSNQPQFSFQKRLEQAELSIETLIQQVKNLSKGNFLYTRLVMNGVSTGELPLKNLSALPKNLNEVYQRFLRHRCSVRKWVHLYQPILGTLTVTQEAISTAQLTKFARISSEQIEGEAQVESAIGVLRQFLDEVEDEQGQKLYTIFHQSLRDYLLDKKQNQDFWCDAFEHHESIIATYNGGTKSWVEVNWSNTDNYGLLHLAKHLYLQIKISSIENNVFSVEEFCQSLYELICKPLMLAKFDRFNSDSYFSEDIKLLIEVAHSLQNLVQEFRGNLILTTLSFRAKLVSPEFIGLWTILGELERAKGYTTFLPPSSITYCKAYVYIGEALEKLGRRQDALDAIDETLNQFVNITTYDEKDENEKIELLIKIIHVYLKLQHQPGIGNVLKSIRDFKKIFPKIFPEIVRAQISLNDINGINETFYVIEEAGASKLQILEVIIDLLLPYRECESIDSILNILKKIWLPEPNIVEKIVSVLFQIRDIDGLRKVLEFDRAHDKEYATFASAYVELGKVFAALGEYDLAIQIVEERNYIVRVGGFPIAKIIGAMASRGDVDRAVSELARITYSDEKIQALILIAEAVVKQDLEQIHFVLSEIHKVKFSISEQAAAFGKISQFLIGVGNIQLASTCIEQALQLVKVSLRPGTTSERDTATSLVEIIPVLVSLEEVDKLLEVQEIVEMMQDGMPLDEGLMRSTGEYKGKVIGHLLLAYCQLNREENIDLLLKITSKMSLSARFEVLRISSRILVQEGQLSQAIKLASLDTQVSANFSKDVLPEIVEAAIQTKTYDYALIAAQAIFRGYVEYVDGERFHPEDSLVKVVGAIAKSGEFDYALAEAEKIQDNLCWIKAIYLIALSLIENERSEKARTIIEQAIEKLEKFNIECNYYSPESIQLIVDALLQSNEIGLVESIIEKLVEKPYAFQSSDNNIEEFNIEDEKHRISVVNSVVQTLLQIGQIELARNIINQLFKEISNLSNSQYVLSLYAKISPAIAQVGETEKLDLIINMCSEYISNGTYDEDIATSLSQIPKALALGKRSREINSVIMSNYWFAMYEEAKGSIGFGSRYLEYGVQKFRRIILEGVIQSLPFVWKNLRLRTLSGNIAAVSFEFFQCLLTNKVETSILLNRLVRAIKYIEDEEQRLYLLTELLIIVVKNDRIHEVSKFSRLINSDLKSIQGSLFEPKILCDLAQVYFSLKQTSKVYKFVNQALSAIASIQHCGWKAVYLSKVSQILLHLNEENRVLELANQVLDSATHDDWNNHIKVGVLIDSDVGWRKDAIEKVALNLVAIGRLDILRTTILEAEKIEDERCKSDILSGIAASLSLNCPEQLDPVFTLIKSFKQKYYAAEVLSSIANSLTEKWSENELNQLLLVTREIRDIDAESRIFSRLIESLVQTKKFDEAFLVWQELLSQEYLNNPQEAFKLLGEGALVIATIDQGKTLINLYEAGMEVETWWKQPVL